MSAASLPPDTSPAAQDAARDTLDTAFATAGNAFNALLNTGVSEVEARQRLASLDAQLAGVWGACFGDGQ